MIPCEPEPIARGEEVDRSGVGLRTGGDLAPYTGQPEIWLTGHAEILRLLNDHAEILVDAIGPDEAWPALAAIVSATAPLDHCGTGLVPTVTVPPFATQTQLSMMLVEFRRLSPVSQIANRIVNVCPPVIGACVWSHDVPPA